MVSNTNVNTKPFDEEIKLTLVYSKGRILLWLFEGLFVKWLESKSDGSKLEENGRWENRNHEHREHFISSLQGKQRYRVEDKKKKMPNEDFIIEMILRMSLKKFCIKKSHWQYERGKCGDSFVVSACPWVLRRWYQLTAHLKVLAFNENRKIPFITTKEIQRCT